MTILFHRWWALCLCLCSGHVVATQLDYAQLLQAARRCYAANNTTAACGVTLRQFASYQPLAESLSRDPQGFGLQLLRLQSACSDAKEQLQTVSHKADAPHRDALRRKLFDHQQQIMRRLSVIAYFEAPQ